MSNNKTFGKKWWKSFKKEYYAQGGASSQGVLSFWIREAAEYLHAQGCSGKAAGRILGQKEGSHPDFIKFAETKGGMHRATYYVRGISGDSQEDTKLIKTLERMIKNGSKYTHIIAAVEHFKKSPVDYIPTYVKKAAKKAA